MTRHLPARTARAIWFAATLAAALCAAAGPAAADETFAPIASELLDGMRNADMHRIPAESGYGRPVIRVRAFRENAVPIPADVANAWNRRLLAELQRQARGQFEFVDGSAVGALVRDIERSDLPAGEKTRRVDDLKANARADIVVAGTVILSGTTPVLSYQAIGSDNGRLFATSAPRRMAYPIPDATPLRSAGPDMRPPPAIPAAAPIPPPAQQRLAEPMGGPLGFRPTVLEAERRLKALGYDPGPVDGILTWQTRRALRAYQLDSALPVNGRMTRRVVDNMRRDTR